MKLLFVMYDNEGPKNSMPVGPCYVAAYAKESGYGDIAYYSQDVYHYPEEHLTKYLDDNRFDVVGIGFCAGYFQLKKIKMICDAIHKSKHRPFIVLGGHGPSPVPEFYIKYMGADATVSGDGELPFLNLVKALENKTPLSKVKGISYRDGDKVVVNEREAAIKDLDSLPFPLYELLPMEYYLAAKLAGQSATDRMIYLTPSRGCTYNCNFCQRLEPGIRLRSPGNIVEEIKKYKKDYNATFIHFVDELFMLSKKRIYDLTEAFLKADLNIKYFCTGRLNIADEEILGMMKRSGCAYIDYGIEQFDNAALAAMDKQQTEDDIIRGITATQKAGINIVFNIIFGNIGDTKKSLRKSIELLKKYNDYGQVRAIRPVTPYPGSPLYYYAIDKGLLKGPEDFYRKHTNLELPTVNFTSIPDKEFIDLMFEANKEILHDHYDHVRDETIETFRKVYYEKDASFRGTRH
ncbi:MAG: radical SAM protein [Candidatus Omnitrophica bacterium]|nr:radical SAM protein [Candidatus Omnitrophota bacterium]